jgi:energy-coupling factor transporter ATP-binding protein EcfA2
MDFQVINKTICLCGKRHSGKSELIKYIVSLYCHQFNKIFVVCPSEAVNKFYSQFLPSENIFTDYKDEWIEKLMTRLIKINVGKKDNESAHILLILDDCVSDVNFHNAKAFEKLFTRGRHLKISLLITTQYPYLIPPVARINCDYILVGQMNKQGLKVMCDEFLMGDISPKEFLKMYYNSTNDYGFLIINNNSTSNNNNINSLYGSVRVPKDEIK